MRDFFSPGRSTVAGLGAAVTSSHALASAAALRMLADGGNAVDAAVAASFVLAVVEPQSTGIGGDCFALVLPAGATRPIGLNGSGRTPAGLDPDRARAKGGAPLGEESVHAVTVPGFVDGMLRLQARFGRRPLAAVMESAIAYADAGFPVYPRVAEEWAFVTGKLSRDPGARDALLRDGRAPQVGEVVRSPALAATLRRIAAEGADGFYRGPVARSMAAALAARGGFHTEADFAVHRGREVDPIATRYRDVDVWQIPPNGQGATALMMLNLLEAGGPADSDFDGAARHRRLADAARVAFAERDRVVADPDFGAVPLESFLDKTAAARLAGRRAPPAAAPAARGDTAYVAVVDGDRNAVSLISSLFEGFGTGIYDPDTGVVFHNRGSGFSAIAGHPNAPAPGKRPLHTIIPGLVTRDGAPHVVLGVTGGPFQPIGQVQILSGILDYGLDVQDAIDRPRSFLLGERLLLEPALMCHAGALAAAGYRVEPADRAVGGAHAIVVDPARGTLVGGSDPRKDGCALAL